jgi:poly-gamma-glutamate capsule biosynthesis protein CapA/YwtB (metallophosphatase superfamily)
MESGSRIVASLGLAASVLVGGCSDSRSGPRVTLTCVGDVMLGRDVRRLCASRGREYPFEQVADLLGASDLTFGNLESPLADGTVRFPRVNALLGAPDMAPVLQQVGFDVMSLANNHAIDGGRTGLRRTCEHLRAAGIEPVGVGATLAEAERGVVVTARGLRVGFLAYSHFPYMSFIHDPERESILMLNEQTLRRTIPPLARRADVVVVSYHWGKEGRRDVSDYERRLAHLAIDLGADIVIGHHAHVRGEIEEYNGGLIAYCLGNFVFDEDSYGGNEGYILRCRLSASGIVDHETTPVRVVDCQARIDGTVEGTP